MKILQNSRKNHSTKQPTRLFYHFYKWWILISLDHKIDKEKGSDENESRKRNGDNNINMLIPKNFEDAMNSENTNKWKDVINKELQNLYGNNVMKL